MQHGFMRKVAQDRVTRRKTNLRLRTRKTRFAVEASKCVPLLGQVCDSSGRKRATVWITSLSDARKLRWSEPTAAAIAVVVLAGSARPLGSLVCARIDAADGAFVHIEEHRDIARADENHAGSELIRRSRLRVLEAVVR